MKDCRLYVFTALFICLTAVKLCFPAVREQAGREISRLICCKADYGEAVQAVGRAIGRGQLVQVLNDLRAKSGGELISVLGQQTGKEVSPSPTPASTLP